MHRLIINADDFGLTHGVNRAIAEARERGVVTSSTLMANALAFDEAVELAKSNDRWSIGCHVVLVDGEPLTDPGRLSSLVAVRNPQRFRDGLMGFAARAFSGRLDPDQIEAETTAQIRKLQSHGISVSHLDTHKHTHTFPVVLKSVLRAARTCGVSAIRNPFDVIAADFIRVQKANDADAREKFPGERRFARAIATGDNIDGRHRHRFSILRRKVRAGEDTIARSPRPPLPRIPLR